MPSLKIRERKRSPIGVDIGETGVRAAQVTADSGLYTVTHTARCERRRQAPVVGRSDTDHADQREAPADCLERCLRQSAFRGRRATTAIDSPDVAFHALGLPEAVIREGGPDTADVVRWEVQRLLTDPNEAVEVGHWALPPARASAPNAIGVAAPSAVVTQGSAACERAGLRCTCVDTAATALCRFASLLKRWGEDEVWGMLDLGARQTRLVLSVDEVPVLVRAAGPGGQAWSRRIAESLQISPKAAEVHKREHGITLAPRGVRPCRTGCAAKKNNGEVVAAGVVGQHPQKGPRREPVPQPPTAELGVILLGCLRSDLTDLASEVKRSYEYVLSCYPPRRAADLILVGGGAAMPNLPEFFSGALGIRVRRASDYLQEASSRLRCGRDVAQSLDVFALAVGLGIEH